jgi:hypothetical protein
VSTTIETGGGDDTLRISSDGSGVTGNLDGIRGTLTIAAGSGSNQLLVSDQSGAAADTNATVTSAALTGFAPAVINYSAIGGTFAKGIFITTTDAAAGDIVAVLSTLPGGNTNLNTGGGDDQINVSSFGAGLAGSLDGILGALAIDAGIGSNTLRVSDLSAVAPDTDAQITSSSLDGFALVPITYTATGGTFGGGVTIALTDLLNDKVTVQNTLPGIVTTINAGNGNDTINVSLTGTARTLNIIGGPGTGDVLNITGTPANEAFAVTPSSIASGTELVNFSTTEAISLNAAGGVNSLSFPATDDTVAITGDRAAFGLGIAFSNIDFIDGGGATNTLTNTSGQVYAAASDTVAGVAVTNFTTVNTPNLSLTAGADTFTFTGSGAERFTGKTAITYTGLVRVDALTGNDTINATEDGDFALSDTSLSIKSGTLQIAAFEVANLTGGAGNNSFNITGFTGTGSLDGGTGTDTVIEVDDVDYTLSETALTRTFTTAGQTFTLASFERANLAGGASNNRFTIRDWKHQASLNGLGGDDIFDLLAGLSGGTSSDPSVLLGGDGNDTFLIQAAENAAIRGLTGAARINGEAGSDTLTASGDLNFILTSNLFTRTISGGANLAITAVNLDVANLTGGFRANLLDAGQFLGMVKLIGKGGIDNLVAGKRGGQLFGFDEIVRRPGQLTKTFVKNAAYTRDNYFVADGTVNGTTTTILATKTIGNALSFRYFVSQDLAKKSGVRYTLPDVINGRPSPDVAAAGNQTLFVTLTAGSGPMDILEGSSFNDVLQGNRRLNTIIGGAGNDRLTAVFGDPLFGGAGRDTFAGLTLSKSQEGNPAINGAASARPAFKPAKAPFVRPPAFDASALAAYEPSGIQDYVSRTSVSGVIDRIAALVK